MDIDERALYKHIGQMIKSRRKEMSITQDRLAVLIGVTRTSVTNIETGLQKLPLHLLYRICDTLEVEVATLLPDLRDVKLQKAAEAVEVGGRTQQMSPKNATFVRGILGDLSDDGH